MTGLFLKGMGESSLPVFMTGTPSSGKRDAPDPCSPARGPPQHSHSLRLPWSPYLVLLRGCCILLSKFQKHPAVCNETRDEQHIFSPYWLTKLSKEDEKSQTEWALSLLCPSRHIPDTATHMLLPWSLLETLFKLNSLKMAKISHGRGSKSSPNMCWEFPSTYLTASQEFLILL